MNKQQEVIQAIRKQLPRLMELEKGCLIKRRKHNNLFDTLEVLKITKTELITTNLDSIGSFNTQIHHLDNFYKLDFFVIIGKEPTILDALECLERTSFKGYSICSNGILYTLGKLDKGIKVPLSKPNIADQSEEIINFLHSVLCKK